MSSALHPSAWRAQRLVLSPFIPQPSLDFPSRQDDFEMFKSLPRQLHLHCVQRLQEVFFELLALLKAVLLTLGKKGNEPLHFHQNSVH